MNLPMDQPITEKPALGKPVVNIDEVPLRRQAHGRSFDARLGSIGALIGARKLGYRLIVLPPGKRAFPFHAHHANEEMFFVISGSGSFRRGAQAWPVRAGDVISATAGGQDSAHQFVNDSDDELRYLAVSTMLEPDVIEYPDSRKFAVFSGAAPGGDKSQRTFAICARTRDAVEYWEGED